ncbi:MAG: translocation/assembly module TamB domain-containing protein [Polyangiaceae bacterium]|nr:translocation/assembly module TamB domain-containing protein [Polyangiaceae bacterium]
MARSAQAFGLAVVFVTAAAGGIVIHSNTKAVRRLAAWAGGEATRGIFAGRISVDVEELTLARKAHLRAAHIEITDPDGKRAVLARGVDVRVDLARLVGSLAHPGPLNVSLDAVGVDDAEIVLEEDASGALGLVRAFASRTPTPEPPPATKADDALHLRIGNVRMGHVWAHGSMAGEPIDATVVDLRARADLASNVFHVDIDRAHTSVKLPPASGARGGAALEGALLGAATVPLAEGSIYVHGVFEGSVDGIPLSVHASIDGDRVEGSVDITKTTADVISRAFPAAAALAQPVALSAKVKGTLPSLAVDARAEVGAGAATVKGTFDVGAVKTFRADVDVEHVDASAFGSTSTDVSGAIHVEGSMDDGGPKGNFTVASKPSTAAGTPLPKLTADGSFDAKKASVKLRATEPGLDAVGNVSADLSARTANFDVTARAADLRAVARVQGLPRGSASVRATGKIDLTKATVNAQAVAQGAGIAVDAASLDDVRASATITGSLAAPVLGVTARVGGVHLKVQDKDPLDFSSVDAKATVTLVPSTRLSNVEVRVRKRGVRGGVTLEASAIGVDRDHVEVRGARMTGLGEPVEIDARMSGGMKSLVAKGENVDLERVAALTGIAQLRGLPKGTRTSLDVDVRMRGARTEGHADLSITAGQDVGGEIHAAFEDRHVRANARVAAGPVGWLKVQDAQIDLPAGFTGESFARATGTADVRGRIDLAQGAALFGGAVVFGGRTLEQASGIVDLAGYVERGDEKALPAVRATVRTAGLDLALSDAQKKSIHLHDIDGSVHFAYDARTDDAEVSGLVWDGHGTVASAGAKVRVPLAAIAMGKRAFTRRDFGKLVASAIVDVPERALHDIPLWSGAADMHGTFAGRTELTGRLGRPNVTATVRFNDVREEVIAKNQPRYEPVDGAIDARWDGERVVVSLSADEHERPKSDVASDPRPRSAATTRESGHLRGLVIARVQARDVIRGVTDDQDQDLPWRASAELDVRNIELALVPSPIGLRGALTGRLKLRQLNENASLEADAKVDGLTVGNVRVKSGGVQVRAQDGMLFSSARIDQDDGGFSTAQILSRALGWKGLDLSWNRALATRVDYDVRAMKLGILRPLVRKFVPEIDGRVDGRGSASIDANTQVFEGGLAIEGGRFYVNAMGEELTNIRAKADFDKSGVFRIEDMSGKIGSGEFRASLTGRMNGIQFQGAEAVITIPQKGGIPLSSDGVTYAAATGEVRSSMTMSGDGRELLVTTTIPRAEITVPDRPTQTLQSLDPDKTIAIGVRAPSGALVPVATGRSSAADANAAADQKTMRFTVVLGSDVLIQGRGVRVYLQGKTLVEIAKEMAITGSFNLKSNGTIDVQGRRFIVDHGTVTFAPGDAPDNPQVVAAAYWDAPDRTRVWVEFAGPIKTGKLVLRSDPAYSKNEILSLLLFGRLDSDASGVQATAVGASVASAGLNQALGELDENVDFEQDSTSANRARSKVGYRLRRDLKVQFGYAQGFSAREQDTTYLFVDWQFLPKWSTVITRGDKGTSILDVLFQHRY